MVGFRSLPPHAAHAEPVPRFPRACSVVYAWSLEVGMLRKGIMPGWRVLSRTRNCPKAVVEPAERIDEVLASGTLVPMVTYCSWP